MITLCFLQNKKHKKEAAHFCQRLFLIKKKKVDFFFFKSRSVALSVAVWNPVAVRRRFLQLVVFEAVKGGSVTLRGGAEELLRAGEGPVLFLSAIICVGNGGHDGGNARALVDWWRGGEDSLVHWQAE